MIKMAMGCKSCESQLLNVGIGEGGRLVIWCPDCEIPVVVITTWPDERFANAKCCKCGKDRCEHEDLN